MIYNANQTVMQNKYMASNDTKNIDRIHEDCYNKDEPDGREEKERIKN
jgi:hypothetical protein